VFGWNEAHCCSTHQFSAENGADLAQQVASHFNKSIIILEVPGWHNTLLRFPRLATPKEKT